MPFFGYVHPGYWLDFGTSEKYLQAHRDLLEDPGRVHRGYRRRGTGLWLAPGVRTGERLLALGRALIGPGTDFGDGVQLHKSVVVGGACRIGSHAVLENCVLWDGVEIGDGARLKGCIVGNGAKHRRPCRPRTAGARRRRAWCRTTAASTGRHGKTEGGGVGGERSSIGMDLGGTNLRVAGVGAGGEVVELYREPTMAREGPEPVIERIVAAVGRGRPPRIVGSGGNVRGVVLGAPGIISSREGTVVASPNLPGWRDVPLREPGRGGDRPARCSWRTTRTPRRTASTGAAPARGAGAWCC